MRIYYKVHRHLSLPLSDTKEITILTILSKSRCFDNKNVPRSFYFSQVQVLGQAKVKKKFFMRNFFSSIGLEGILKVVPVVRTL